VELKDPAVIAPYRISQDMAVTFLNKMKKRKAKCGIRCFQRLITTPSTDLDNIAAIDSDSKTSLSEQLKEMTVGTLIIYAKHEGKTFAASAFRGKQNLQLYISKDEVEIYKSQLVEAIGEPEKIEGVEEVKKEVKMEVEPVSTEPKAPEHVKF